MGNIFVIDSSDEPKPRRRAHAQGPVESAVHFGIKVRGSQKLGLRIERNSYALINKKSSMGRMAREMDPAYWDSVDKYYEDGEHRVYTDEWCAKYQALALKNYDLNMAHFASLDHDEFDNALQEAIASQPGMTAVTDLTKWDGVPGLYVMVLDGYSQVYVGATDHIGGIKLRMQQHWRGSKQFDRLLWGGVNESILSIDSFRALDTTRIFALNTTSSFDQENDLLDLIPPKFVLNRLRGGRDAVRFAALLGVEKIMKTRDLLAPEQGDQEPR